MFFRRFNSAKPDNLRLSWTGYTGQDFINMLWIALAYALLGKLMLSYFSAAGNVTLAWFPGGMALAMLILKGLRMWPAVFVGAYAAGLLVEDAFWLCFFIALGNTLESLTAAWLLKRFIHGIENFDRRSDLVWLTLAGVGCASISAFIGVAALWQFDFFSDQALPAVILHWWMADVFGIITTAPVILIWRHWPSVWFHKSRLFETILFFATTLLIALAVFLDFFPGMIGDLPQVYWMFGLMFWGAMRFGRHGVQGVASITAVTALMGAAAGKGYFAHDFEKSGLLNYWLFQTLFSGIGSTLALTLHDVRQANVRTLASEQRLRAVFETSPVGYALCDQQENIILLNPAFSKLLGYTQSDIPTLNDWWQLAFPVEAGRKVAHSAWCQALRESRQTGRYCLPLELDIRCANGDIRHMQLGSSSLSGAPMDDQLMTLLDLTEQYQANQALSDANLLLHTILETLPIRVYWKDKQFRYLGANTLFAWDAGVATVDALIGKQDAELAWAERAALYELVDEQVISTGQCRLNDEIPQTHANGETVWLRSSRLPLRDSAKEIIGVLGVYEDITPRKRLDEKLSMRTAFLEALLESSPDGILVVGQDGRKLLQNRRVAELWRIPEEIAEQKDDARQLAFVKTRLKNPEQFLHKVAELYKHTDQSCQDEIECIDGIILHRYSSPVRDKTGRYFGRIWQFTDITQMRQAQLALQKKEYYQRALLDNFPFMVWLKDNDCRYLAVNKVLAEQLHTSIEAIINKSDLDIFPPEQAEHYRVDDQQVMSCGRQINIEEKIKLAGKYCWVETYKAPLLDEQGQVLGTVGFARDISLRKEAEEAMKLAALVFDNSSEAMLVTDANNVILNVNAAFTQMTGYTKEEVLGKDPKILGSGEQSPAFYQAMWQSINATGYWQGELKNRRKNGELYIEEIVINTIFDSEGKPQRRVALFFDITKRKQSEEQIWQQANFDPLTGLPNRNLLRERLGLEIKKAHRMQQRFALLFIDLDRFKEVNDTLGHEMGDALLQQAAQRLLACVRDSDTVARLGGDEFTIILSDLDPVGGLERLAKHLVEQLGQPFVLGDERLYISASIGITLYPDDGQTLSQLLRNADQAMYAAKNKGRNCYSFFTLSMQAELNVKAALLNDMRSALPRQEFKLAFQPIVDLHSGQVYKAEALLRWQHPVRGLVSPAEFVPLAEDSGLINEIGDWVFQMAVEQVKQWRQALHPEFQISINKSPVQFMDTRHQSMDWIQRLHSANLPGHAIVVEITEGLLLDASSRTADQLLVFRDAGVQVAIDDFGTGYSALSYLKKFDIDYLKIDQSFVRNLAPASSDFVLCEAIIVMAHKLGLKVIAEGVETELQRDLLASVACDFAQGYLFARPMPAEEFTIRYSVARN